MRISHQTPLPQSGSSWSTPRGRRRRWLVIATLVSLVALYATQATHLPKTDKDVRACAKCDVERPVVWNASTPELKIVPLRRAFVYVDLQTFSTHPVQAPAAFKPQSRAPPVLAS